ncbi:hypothetical protein [Micromonospora sp. WMMD1082]|uniref:hypothetical protein n=1 Tax=Micromonospora sp. WMMD1082 TaxID=3016104 RepID=UPI002415C019|nr:hypothetical protein [Micromonospora sp. WMMD1082]MDG4795064.1 hypothetical protein [Micromonospora sp. WMMD1082]
MEAVRAAVTGATDDSTRTGGDVWGRPRQILEQRHHGLVAIPSPATSYRLVDKLAVGLHTTDSARPGPSAWRRPRRRRCPGLGVFAPGELMEMDSTPLAVLLDDGTTRPVEATGVLDIAIRTVTAAVLRPGARPCESSACPSVAGCHLAVRLPEVGAS